jgi:hypothetical protein
MFHNNCSITLYITVNKKTVIFRSKTVYTGPLPQLYGSFLHIFQLRSFQIIILQTFLIAIIINNNIGKYLFTRQNIKKERNCKFLVKGHYFKIGLIPKVISIRKKKISIFDMYIPCEASSWTLLHQNRKLSSRISLQNQLFCFCRLPVV